MRSNSTIPTGPGSHQRRGFTPQDRMMSPGPSSHQRKPLPPQGQVMQKAGVPSRKNSFDQEHESQHRRGQDNSNDGSNQNSLRNYNDGYAYESPPSKKTSDQSYEPWRNNGAGQNHRERSSSFNDNSSSNYSRGANAHSLKSNPGGPAQRANDRNRTNNRRSRSRSSSTSDQTRAAPYRRDNLSPRHRRTDSSHSPTPDRRSPRDDFKARHHSPDRGRYGHNHGHDRVRSQDSHYGERRPKMSSPTPADTRHTPQWTPHVPAALTNVQPPQVYGMDEAYLQQTPYHTAAAPIPYAALLANSPAFVQGLAQLSALLAPQQTPPIDSLYSIASALVSGAALSTAATVLGPPLVSTETGGVPVGGVLAAGTSTPGTFENPLYAMASLPEQASQPIDCASVATSIPPTQRTTTPLQVDDGAPDALLARLSDPVTARLLQSISPFLSQIPSTNMAPSPPTASIASATPVASQPISSYPESHRLESESSASRKDTALGSTLPTSDASVSAPSFESSDNGVSPSKESIKITELPECKPSSANDGVQLDVKSENDMSVVVAASPTLAVKDIPEEAAASSTSDSHEGVLIHKDEPAETDFVAIKAEKESEPRIASVEAIDASMDVAEDHERSEVATEEALMKREPSIEPHCASLEDSVSSSTETGLPSQQTGGEPKDPNSTVKAETMECGTSLADEPGPKMTQPVIESSGTLTVESELPSPAESMSTLSRTVECALEQSSAAQELDHFKEPISVNSAIESTETMDLGMELDHAMDDMTTEARSPEKPKAERLSDSEPGDGPTSIDMELVEEFPTVPDVENASPGPTSLSRADGSPAQDDGSHQENQPHLSSSPPRTFERAHSAAQKGIRVYTSWHHVPGADMALLSEMRASSADLGRFRRETRWLEERVSRPRRDAVSEDMFDKALGLTRMIPLPRRKRDHPFESQQPKQKQDQDQDQVQAQDQDRSQLRSREQAEREEQHMTRSFGAAVRLSADSRLAYSTFKTQLMEEMEEQLRLESEQSALQRAVERTENKIKLKQRLGEQAGQKMREVLEKQAELDRELESVRKEEQEYLERREQQRRTAEEEIRQLEETLRTLQEQHQHHRLQHQPLQQQGTGTAAK
ncbi:unnamed protein product [Mortierella alpina]